MQLMPTPQRREHPGAGGSLRLALAAAARPRWRRPPAPRKAPGGRGGAGTFGHVPWQVDSAVLVYKEGGGRVAPSSP
jgi:hypothetical protein